VAVGVGVTSAIAGLTISYHLATPPGPTIALVTVAWFAAATVASQFPRLASRRPRPDPTTGTTDVASLPTTTVPS
jgi:hypothetical protein